MNTETENVGVKKDNAIIAEIANVLVNLGATSDIISIVASWKDTLEDDDVLNYLREWNSNNQLQHQ